MPVVRYQIRNEYGLADPELYRAADQDDPEALLEGVAMAGLVGVLRQLGDLAEFAAEIFHELHEEVMATAARGHGLKLRVQQLEADFPSVEKAFLSQTNHSHFGYNAGIHWHANHRTDKNLITRGDMPRFILDSYEECRGPPRLFMLDKFDVAGAGACLKRYSDPSFFKTELASSGIMEAELQREKKGRKIRKKLPRWKNGKVVDTSLALYVKSEFEPYNSEPVPEKPPTRRVKLKSRHLDAVDTNNRTSYMKGFLEVLSAKEKVVQEYPKMHSIRSTDSGDSAPDIHEILIDNSYNFPSYRERNHTQPLLPTNELENQNVKSEEFFEALPEPEPCNKVENMHSIFKIVEEDGISVKSEDKTDVCGDSNRSSEAKKDAQVLQAMHQKKILSEDECTAEEYRSDDIGSDVDNFMDALNTIESETETDYDSKSKLYPGFSNKDSPWIHSNTDERQHELPWHSSESQPVEKSKTAMSMRNSIIPGIPSLHDADNITMTQSSLRELESIEESKTEICMRNNIITGKPSLHDADNITMAQSSLRDIMALEDLQRNSEVIEFESPVRVLSDGLCSVEAHEGPGFRPAIREATSCSSAMDSTSSLIRTYPQGSSTEVKSTSSDSSEISSYVRNGHIVGKHLDDNPPCMTESSTASKLDEDIVGLSLAIGDVSGKIYPAEPEGLTDMIDTPCDVSHKQDDIILRCFAEHIEDLLRPEQDSWNQDMEASETVNSSNSSAIYPVDSSLVVQPDDLAAEKECLGQAGVLDSEIFPESVRATQATQEVSEQLDGQSSGDYVPEISQSTEDEEVMTEKLDVLEHLPKAQNIVALENVHVGYVEDLTLSPTMSIGEVTTEKLDVLEHFPEEQNLVALENVSDRYVEDSTLSPTMSIGEPEVMAEKLDVLEHFPEAQNLVALENVSDGYVEDSTLSPTMSNGEPEVVTEKLDVLEHLPEAQNLVASENVVEDSTFFPTMSIGEPEVVKEKLDVLEHLPEAQNIVALENVPDGYVEDLALPPTMSIGEPEEPEVMMEKLDELEHLPKAQNLVAVESVHDGYVEDSTLPPTMSIGEPEVMMEKLDELEQLPKAQNPVAVENVHDGHVEDSIFSPTMSIEEPKVMMEKLDELEQLPKAQNLIAVENVHDGYVEDSTFSPIMSIEEPEVMMEKLDALEHLPEAQNLVALQNVPDGYVEDLTFSPTMSIGEAEVSSEHDAESCSCGNLSQNAHANSPFIDYAAGVDEEADGFIASGEVLASSGSDEDTENADYVIDAKISDPSILTLESELLSNEESLDDKGVELEDHDPSSPRKTTLPGNSQVQSTYKVTYVPHPISDDFGIPIGCTVSALHHVSEQIVDSSSNIVTAETVVDHDETSVVHSPEISGFDGQSQDLVPSDAYPNQQSLDTDEASSPTNAELLYSGSTLYSLLIPKDGNLLVSVPAATSSDLCTSKLSDSSDNELSNGVCHTMSSEHSETPMDPTIDEDRQLCSVESERDFSPGPPFRSCSQESEKDETPYFVHPVMPDEESSKEKPDDESEMSPSQEGELLVPSDLQSETIRVVEQEDTLNSVEFDGKPPESGLERESDTMSTDGNYCELDIPTSSNTDTLWQLELEASVPSECSSVHPVNSSPPNATSENGELLFVAGVDLTNTEFATEQFSEPSISSDTFPGPQIQNTEEAPPLPPLPPLEWRMGKLRLGSSDFDGSFSQPLFGTSLFSAPFIKVEAETIQLANMSVTLPSKEESKPHHTLSNSENKRLQPLKLSELPPIMGDRPHVYSHNALREGMLPPSNPFAPFQFLEHEASQLYHTGERNQPLQDSRPQLGQVLPALDLEIYQHAEPNGDINGLQSMDPFSVEEDKYQYNVGGYRGENLQYLTLSAPLPTKEPMMPHHGYVSSAEGHSHMLDDGMLHTMEDVKPNRRFPSIRDLPRHPLIDAVAAHDKTKLRKVSELVQPSTKPKAERDSLLEQIRNKSFNLKPASATKPNIKGPRTNLKVAAILEKANAIRQACAGSDEDDDGDSWSDS